MNGVAGMILTLIMGILIAGVILNTINTDAMLGSNTASVASLSNLAFVGFTIAGVGIITYAGYIIIQVFT